ncbi:hypothetical protein [Mucilaginibacter sp.]|uniref:hypothetical protein n=1 Tax=Mucilaginibacter sp. TaxID=1882438 RepID=UPI00260AB041|nr:hypothetical protein [Mucilaginibacter sp.]
MQNKVIGLSRSGKYADKASVDAFVEQFGLSPDNVRSQAPSNSNSTTDSQSSTGSSDNSSSDSSNSGDSASSAGSTTDSQNASSQGNGSGTQSVVGAATKDRVYGIEQSDIITQRLASLKSPKLISLYRSLCVVSAVQHAQLLYIGAWSFFESLTALHGRLEGTPFDGYFGSILSNNNMGYNRTEKKDFQHILKEISDKGNANKHSARHYSTSAVQLRTDFTTLEPLIVAVIDLIINKSPKP